METPLCAVVWSILGEVVGADVDRRLSTSGHRFISTDTVKSEPPQLVVGTSTEKCLETCLRLRPISQQPPTCDRGVGAEFASTISGLLMWARVGCATTAAEEATARHQDPNRARDLHMQRPATMLSSRGRRTRRLQEYVN